jgi:hypothetical protein
MLVPVYQITEHFNARDHNTESCRLELRGCAGEYTVLCVEIEVLYAHYPRSAIFSSIVHISSTNIACFHFSSFSLLLKKNLNFLYICYKMSNWNELLVTTPIRQIHKQVGLNLRSLEYPVCMITTRPLQITTVSCVLVPCILQCRQLYGVYAYCWIHVQLFS